MDENTEARLSFLRSRISVREFEDQPIPEETLEQILDTATCAPNAHNRQSWRFVVLKDRAALRKLVEAMNPDYRTALLTSGLSAEDVEARVQGRGDRIKGGAAGVVLCYDAQELNTFENDPARQRGEEIMAVQSAALAGGQMLLAAHALGLAGVWLCAPLFAPESVQQAFDLPASWHPQGLILLGNPATIPPRRPRKPLEDVVKFAAG